MISMNTKKQLTATMILILVLTVFISTATANTSSGVVTRTLDKKYINLTNPDDIIKVTINASNNADMFEFYGVVETLPENMNVAVMPGQNVTMTSRANTTDGTKTDYIFTGFSLNSAPLRYNISSENLDAGAYTITGYFKDSYNNSASVIPDSVIKAYNFIDPIIRYDTDNDNKIERPEVINDVSDYFKDQLSLEEVMVVVRAYLGL